MDRYHLDYREIIENVKELRRIKSWSQEELSERADLSLSAISRFEINQREINLKTFVKIANAFDVDVNYLLGHETEELGQQDLLINNLIRDFTYKDKELLISIITAIRNHKQ